MAADGGDPPQESYAHLFVDSFGDLDALRQTFADDDAVEEDEVDETEEIEPLSEYEERDPDAESSTTIPPVDQWEHENANVLNSDEYGFGLDHDIDADDTRLFDEAGLQPDGFGMIPWDVVIKDLASKDDGMVEISEESDQELEQHYAAGHVPKDPRCPICQRADGPVRVHKTTPTELKTTVLLSPCQMFAYLWSKEGKQVVEAIRTSILLVESVHTGMYAEGKRVHTILSDKGSEFENKEVSDVLADLAVYQTFTSRYPPQSSGAAEVNVRIVKQFMSVADVISHKHARTM
eukprot:2164202-Amphidinium_carterae.2